VDTASLVGTWRLVDASFDEQPAFGESPRGVLIYTADGHVSVAISHDGRRALSVEDRVEAPPGERADAFATFFAYSGRYSVSGHEVRHEVEVASVPNWVDTVLVRDVRVEGDTLVLHTPPTPVGGAIRVTRLVWKRVAP